MLESKDMLKKNTTYDSDGSMLKGHNSQLKEQKLEQYEQGKKIVLDFNPKCTITIHDESILT